MKVEINMKEGDTSSKILEIGTIIKDVPQRIKKYKEKAKEYEREQLEYLFAVETANHDYKREILEIIEKDYKLVNLEEEYKKMVLKGVHKGKVMSSEKMKILLDEGEYSRLLSRAKKPLRPHIPSVEEISIRFMPLDFQRQMLEDAKKLSREELVKECVKIKKINIMLNDALDRICAR